MAKRKNKTIVIVSIIFLSILLVGGLIAFTYFTNIIQIFKSRDFASVQIHYYKGGVEVFPERFLQSIVTPPGGSYDAISFSVTITNNGQIPLTDAKMSRLNVNYVPGYSGAQLNAFSSLPQTGQQDYFYNIGNFSIGDSKSFTSSLVPVSQFESYSQPVNFSVNVIGTNTYNGSTITGKISKSLTITPPFKGLCYQETVTVSTSCGGLATGSYSTLGTWNLSYPASNVYDENWNTYGISSSGYSRVYINYTKPDRAQSTSLWQTKDPNWGMMNQTIPSSCWNAYPNKLVLLVETEPPGFGGDWCCSIGSGWSCTYGFTGGAYEEAMWWNIQ